MNFVRDFWDIVLDVVGFFQIATVIDSYEQGVLLRFGNFKRTLKPGLRWHLPFGIDEITTMNVKPGVMELDEQVCTTADDYKIACSGVLQWSVFDIRRACLDVEDVEDALSDIALGFIQEMVEATEVGRHPHERVPKGTESAHSETSSTLGYHCPQRQVCRPRGDKSLPPHQLGISHARPNL